MFKKKKVQDVPLAPDMKDTLAVNETASKKKDKRPLRLIGTTNAVFGSELAFHMSNTLKLKTLIIDADALRPTVAFNLGVKEMTNGKIETEIEGDSSLNVAVDYLAKNPKPVLDVLRMIPSSCPKNGDLAILTGNDEIENYEAYSTTTFEILIKQATFAYGLVIVVVPDNIYDAFYQLVLEHCEIMVYAPEPHLDNLYALNKNIEFLNERLPGSSEKHKIVAFSYDADINSPKDAIVDILGDRFFGVVSRSRTRDLMRDDFLKIYADNMTKKNVKEYNHFVAGMGHQLNIKRGWFGRKRG